MHALAVALGLVAALAGGLTPRAGHTTIVRASCPPGAANCRAATGHVAYVETYDRDGDGDAHYVLLGGDITAPGLSVIDVEKSMRPPRLPRAGDEVSAAGPVYPGTYGQHQIQATVIHYGRRR